MYYEPEAIVATIITITSMLFWYRDVMIVYNIFKWTEQDEAAEMEEWKGSRPNEVNNHSFDSAAEEEQQPVTL